MLNTLTQSFPAVISNAHNIRPAAAWQLALVLLGLAATAIILGALFPSFFADSFNHFGSDTP